MMFHDADKIAREQSRHGRSDKTGRRRGKKKVKA